MYRLRLIIVFSAVLVLLQGAGFLQTNGQNIVDENGSTILLRGFGLGGWLVQEGYMWNTHGFFGSTTNLKNKIINLVGEDNANTFYQTYYQNYITEADVSEIAAQGFNTLRVPFHYKFFSPAPGEFTNEGFNLLAPLLDWCSTYGVYLILDMHCAPGAQNTNDFSDSDGQVAGLWIQQSYRDWTMAVWWYIASHYADEEWIAGYDLLNEPVLSGGFTSSQLRQFYIQLTSAIRQVDENHIIFIEGNWYANDFTNLTPPFDGNMAYSFHHYVGPSQQTGWIGQYTSMSQINQVPLWVGEFGENSNHWAHNKVELFENNNVSWSLWNYKHNGSITAALRVQEPEGFQEIVNYWGNGAPAPSSATAVAGLMDLAEAYLFENCVINKGLFSALSDTDYNSSTKPFTDLIVPDIVEAVYYDIGASGIAYNDVVYEDADKFGSNSQSWNNGWVFRNDGVDIEYSSDNTRSGLNIGWIENGEWLIYTVWAPYSRSYNFSFNTASPNENGQLLLSVVGQSSSEVFQIPKTNGWQNWAWTDTASAHLSGGENGIRLQALTGGFNLKSIKIEGASPNTVPEHYTIRNYPNPFNTETTFYFPNSIETISEIEIYDTEGKIVQYLQIQPNHLSVTWDGKDQLGRAAGSGVYIYQVKMDLEKSAGKMTLIR